MCVGPGGTCDTFLLFFGFDGPMQHLALTGGIVFSVPPQVYVDTSSDLETTNTTFTSNTSGSGGAIYMDTSGAVTTTGGSFTSNTADFGGAIASWVRLGEPTPMMVPLSTCLLLWAGLYLREDRLQSLLPLRKKTAR